MADSSVIVDTYRRVLLGIAGTRPGAAVYKHLVPLLDRLFLLVTRGRHTYVDHIIPTLVLTSTGRRSGQPRTSPLCYLRDGADLIVVGTNWGGEAHPAWTGNLAAQPRASVLVRGRETAVTASEITGPEWQDHYRRFEAMGPNYASYLRWSEGRTPRMFRLTPR